MAQACAGQKGETQTCKKILHSQSGNLYWLTKLDSNTTGSVHSSFNGIKNTDLIHALVSQDLPALDIAIPESRDHGQFRIPGLATSQSGISGLQKLAKILLFCALYDRNKNFSRLVNKIFYERFSSPYYFVLSPEICISTVTVTLHSSDIGLPFVGALCMK